MQAIQTTYHGPTNTRGARIVARCDAGRLTVAWDYALSIERNHDAAAIALARKLGWLDAGPRADNAFTVNLVRGVLHSGAFVYVFTFPHAIVWKAA
jgi:hypothetical protein